jgi:hypothetical protein
VPIICLCSKPADSNSHSTLNSVLILFFHARQGVPTEITATFLKIMCSRFGSRRKEGNVDTIMCIVVLYRQKSEIKAFTMDELQVQAYIRWGDEIYVHKSGVEFSLSSSFCGSVWPVNLRYVIKWTKLYSRHPYNLKLKHAEDSFRVGSLIAWF